MDVKYIRTKADDIIVFGATIFHKEFKDWQPKSAGFIRFTVNDQGRPTCKCYGESISLGLASDEVEDTRLAKLQLGMYY
jgi:hypothetical protein